MKKAHVEKNKLPANQKIAGIIVVAIPILLYWVYWTLHPSYWFNADPAAIYFIDSMSVFIGESYKYVDHPGTPMQVIGSLLLAVVYPFFESRSEFIQFFLSRPAPFFFMVHLFLLATNLICAWYFYHALTSVLTARRALAAIAITLLFFSLHPDSFQSLTLWSHNSLNYPIGTFLLVWLYRTLLDSKPVTPAKLILIGIASGAFAIAQLYFFAWIATCIVTVTIFTYKLQKDIKAAIRSGMLVAFGGLLGVLAMLLPIYNELPRFLKWLHSIATHLGAYGLGEQGLYSASLITSAIVFWWKTIPQTVILLLLCFCILGAVLPMLQRNNINLSAADTAMVTGLVFHIILLIFILTKAAIKLRYSLSIAASLPVLVFVVIKILDTTSWKIQLHLTIFYILAAGSVLVNLIAQKSGVDHRHQIEKMAPLGKSQAVNLLANALDVSEDDIVVIHTFGVPLKCSGLLHATNWTGTFQKEVSEICPNQFAYWDSAIELNMATAPKALDEINWDILIWPGNGSDLPNYLNSIGSENIPAKWPVLLKKWFFIHSSALEN